MPYDSIKQQYRPPNVVDGICHHLIDSGFDVHPPWHPFGCRICQGPLGSARIYMGSAHEWLHTNRNSEHIVDLIFYQVSMALVWPPHAGPQSAFVVYPAQSPSNTIRHVGAVFVSWMANIGRPKDEAYECLRNNNWGPDELHYCDRNFFAHLYDMIRVRADIVHTV